MPKKELTNYKYREFIKSHILRPYQNMIINNDKPVKYSKVLYCNIPNYMRENQEWMDNVFNRISRIYSCIDRSIFPNDNVAPLIRSELIRHGVDLV